MPAFWRRRGLTVRYSARTRMRWTGFGRALDDLDLLVQEGEVEQAKDILSNASGDGCEPAEEPKDAPPAADEAGICLPAPVGGYENVGRMRDAPAVQASAGVDTKSTRLVLRGDRGPRELASVLSWRLRNIIWNRPGRCWPRKLKRTGRNRGAQMRIVECDDKECCSLKYAGQLVGLNERAECECTSCNYRAGTAEFLNHDGE